MMKEAFYLKQEMLWEKKKIYMDDGYVSGMAFKISLALCLQFLTCISTKFDRLESTTS